MNEQKVKKTPDWKTNYLVKKEYLVKESDLPKIENESNKQMEQVTKQIGGQDRDKGQKNKKKKRKGKKRNREDQGFIDPKPINERLCPQLCLGEACRFPDNCKYMHDLKTFLNSKREDIGNECYVFNEFGFCRAGFRCRFAGAHIKKPTSENPNPELIVSAERKEIPMVNMLTKDKRQQLRQRKYFKVNGIKTYDAYLKEQQQNNEDTNDANEKTVKENGDEKVKENKNIEQAQVEEAKESESVKGGANNGESAGDGTVSEVKTNNGTDAAKNGESTGDVTMSDPKTNNETDAAKNGESTDAKTTTTNETYSAKTKPPTDDVTMSDAKATTNETNTTTSSNEKLNTSDDAKPIGIAAKDCTRHEPRTISKLDMQGKTYVAPLTTVGNLPFRRVLKQYDVDITCGEMAFSHNLLSGQNSEWALLRRHPSEDIFGIQLAGSAPRTLGDAARLVVNECEADFIDLNMGCPIDMVTKGGSGSKLMTISGAKFCRIVQGMTDFDSAIPVGLKMRMGYKENELLAHKIMSKVQLWTANGSLRKNSIAYMAVHGRTRAQRYSRRANYDYISTCCKTVNQVAQENQMDPIPILGNGDIFSYLDWEAHVDATKTDAEMNGEECKLSSCMIGRGALIKPWLATEIKERRHWDISASERFDMLQKFTNFGLEHWGSDEIGVNNTRRYLLEWLSFLHRYIPVGLLEHVPQEMCFKPPLYFGRNDLETLMASPKVEDWIVLSERLLGPRPEGFKFEPKHKANSYVARNVA